MLSDAAPLETPWVWSLAYGQHEDRMPTNGQEATREAAMQASARSWKRETLVPENRLRADVRHELRRH